MNKPKKLRPLREDPLKKQKMSQEQLERYQLNKQIGLLLGFQFLPPRPKHGIHHERVQYPASWKRRVISPGVSPLPDFVRMLDQALAVNEIFLGGVKLMPPYFPDPDEQGDG